MLKVNPVSNTGNQLYFYVYNETDERMWFKCSYNVFDQNNSILNCKPSIHLANPCVIQEVDKQDNKCFAIDLGVDVHQISHIEFIITEQQVHFDSRKKTNTFRFRLICDKWEEIDVGN